MDEENRLSKEQKYEAVDAFLLPKGFSIERIIDSNFLIDALTPKRSLGWVGARYLCHYFHNLKPKDLLTDGVLPPSEKWGFQRKSEKIRILDHYLREKKGVALSRAVSVSEREMKSIVEGCALPSHHLLRIVADYFFLDYEVLENDDKDLPKEEELVVDEDLVAIQRKDFLAEAEKNKHRHVIRRSWQILSRSQRIWLVTSCAAILVPLLGFTVYCAYDVIQDRYSSILSYTHDEMDDTSKAIEKTLRKKDDATSVKLGSEVISIGSITSSNYQARLSVWFDFDQLEFHRTMCSFNAAINYYDVQEFGSLENRWSAPSRLYDRFGWDVKSGSFLNESNGVPDFIESADFLAYPLGKDKATQNAFLANLTLSPVYSLETSYYPSEAATNNYPGKTSMWGVRKGTFVPDSFIYDAPTPYTLTPSSTPEAISFRMFQRCRFTCQILKSFDCPRYPLDSEQLEIVIDPRYTSDVLRYVQADSLSLEKLQQTPAGLVILTSYGAAEEKVYTSGVSASFNISDGYELISSSPYIRSNSRRLSYAAKVVDATYTEVVSSYQILVRVARKSINLFLQAFANLFAVIVWITIAFYDQSYNGEDSIGMLGTGLFGVISSVLVGISMISDSNLFSLITMINIFTLFVIMLMAYEAILSKRAKIKKDLTAMAYNVIKLRILFYILIICTLTMFIGLPILSYIIF